MTRKLKVQGEIDSVICRCDITGRLAKNAIQGTENCSCTFENETTGEKITRKVGTGILSNRKGKDIESGRNS